MASPGLQLQPPTIDILYLDVLAPNNRFPDDMDTQKRKRILGPDTRQWSKSTININTASELWNPNPQYPPELPGTTGDGRLGRRETGHGRINESTVQPAQRCQRSSSSGKWKVEQESARATSKLSKHSKANKIHHSTKPHTSVDIKFLESQATSPQLFTSVSAISAVPVQYHLPRAGPSMEGRGAVVRPCGPIAGPVRAITVES